MENTNNNNTENIPVQKPKTYTTTPRIRNSQYSNSQYSNSQYSNSQYSASQYSVPQEPPRSKSPVGKIIALSSLLAALVLGLVLLIPMLTGQEDTVLCGGKKVKVAGLSTNSDYGTVNGGGSYRKGDDVTLVAVPKEGCIFAGWSDGYSEPERTVTAGDEEHYTAVFYGPLSEWTTQCPDDAVIMEEDTFYQVEEGTQFLSDDPVTPYGCVLVETTRALVSSESYYVPDYWPTGFSTSHPLYDELQQEAPVSSDYRDVTAGGEGYVYFHWCRGDRVAPKPPTNRKVATSCQGEFDTFHAYYSTYEPMHYGPMTEGTYHAGSVVPNPSDYGAYYQPNSDCCCDSYWFFDLPVTKYNVDLYEVTYIYESDGSIISKCPDGVPCTEVTQYRYRPQ